MTEIWARSESSDLQAPAPPPERKSQLATCKSVSLRALLRSIFPAFYYFPHCKFTLTAHTMPGDETRRKLADDSDSEEDSDSEQIVKVDVDPSKLTPLSPEVISKQVRLRSTSILCILWSLPFPSSSRQRSILVRGKLGKIWTVK